MLAPLTRLTSLKVQPRTCYGVDCNTIAQLPLVVLEVEVAAQLENYWCVVPKLTNLERLTVENLTADEDLLRLTALNRLTSLTINKKSPLVSTTNHLTDLSTLQELVINYIPCLTQVQLELKLTRLRRYTCYN
jgi:hypothetical protein